jgi:acyl-coenzyme A thioesterase PaaI-like protein
VSRTRVDRAYAGYRDFAHGGVIATMLDEAMGWAMLHIAGSYGMTKSLAVTYRRPVSVEQEILLGARVLSRQDNRVALEAWIEDARGRVLAKGEGEWSVVKEERAA